MPSTLLSPYEQEDLLRADLISKIEKRHKVVDQIASTGLLPYLNQLVIDVDPQPRLFRDVADPWQWSLRQKYCTAIENVCGIKWAPDFVPVVGEINKGKYLGPRNYWFTMPRGHSKTTMLAEDLNWVLAYSKRPLVMYAAAADKDQAGLLLEAMQKEAQLNPWLAKRLNFRSYHVTGTSGSKLTVVSSDAASSFGQRPDLVVLDELTHWAKRDLWDVINSGLEKRRSSVLLVITNAGILGSWQHSIVKRAKTSPNWFVYEVPTFTHLASWMSKEAIAERRKDLLPQMARRVYDNAWLDPSESCGWVSRAEAQACEDLGAELNLRPRKFGKPEYQYFGAVDYGPSRDRTAMVLMHREPCDGPGGERIIIDRLDVLQGKKTKHVPIADVEAWLDEVRKDFNIALMTFDQYQLEGTIQRYSRLMPVEVFTYRGGKTNFELAQTLRNYVVDQRIVWPPGIGDVLFDGKIHTLVDEFTEVSIKEQATGGGYRITNPPGTHDDRVVTIGMALLGLLKSNPKRDLWLPENPEANNTDTIWF